MEIKQARFIISSPKEEMCPEPGRPEFAFIGRSNVGKSSLINMLSQNGKLAKVSSSPGKTTLINHFIINEKEALNSWYLVDLPGYGYARRSKKQRIEWQEMLADYFIHRENLMNVFVLIDSRHPPQKNDLEFLKNLSEWGAPFSLIFTKSDKSNQATVSKNVKSFVNAMKKDWQFIPAKFITSAEKGTGRKQVLGHIGELIASVKE